MDQQNVDTQRLRREVTYHVTDMQKAQDRRLNRFRTDLRDTPLPADQLNLLFRNTAQAWEQAFVQLEAQLTLSAARLLDSGIPYATIHTALERVSTSTLHTLLDTRITSDRIMLCSRSDRMLRLTTRNWTLIMYVVVGAAAVLALTSVLSVPIAIALAGAAVLARIVLEGLCMLRVRANRDRVPDLQEHMLRITAQFQRVLNDMPVALTQALES